jgi:uncharacterized protein (TIGR00730 family)
MRALRRVAVFCGSNAGGSADYARAAIGLAAVLAQRQIELVYGAGNVGLMGVLADAMLAAGGRVIGVIPQALKDKEVCHLGLQDLRVVGTMHERKALMVDLSDAFIALPGGYGTLDELCEVLTWAQLGLHSKPCGLMDVRGYFRPFLAQIDQAVSERFLTKEHRRLVVTHTESAALLDALTAFVPVDTTKWIADRDV